MDFLNIITIILEGLTIADIATTEYAIKEKNCEESNPLWRNNKKRWAMYPFKLTVPIITNVVSRLDPRTPIVGAIANSVLTIGMVGVIANNLYQILRKDGKCKIN